MCHWLLTPCYILYQLQAAQPNVALNHHTQFPEFELSKFWTPAMTPERGKLLSCSCSSITRIGGLQRLVACHMVQLMWSAYFCADRGHLRPSRGSRAVKQRIPRYRMTPVTQAIRSSLIIVFAKPGEVGRVGSHSNTFVCFRIHEGNLLPATSAMPPPAFRSASGPSSGNYPNR